MRTVFYINQNDYADALILDSFAGNGCVLVGGIPTLAQTLKLNPYQGQKHSELLQLKAHKQNEAIKSDIDCQFG